jgi:hypothetical protein
MKLKLVNIISIFVAIIIIGCVLIPWSKSNTTTTESFAVEVLKELPADNSSSNFITLFNYILESRKFSFDFENRVRDLKTTIENNGIVKYEDYIEIINELNDKLNEEQGSKKKIGKYLLTQNTNESQIQDLKNQIELISNKITENIKNDRLNNPSPTYSYGIVHKTIKSVKYGINLSIQELVNGKIMIHLNNGCLTYDKENPQKEYYSVKNCEITNTQQHFIIRKNIKNYVISPVNNLDLCLKVDNIGLSLEKYEQPFNPFVLATPPPEQADILNYPEEYVWIILPFETNNCKKIQKNKITIVK